MEYIHIIYIMLVATGILSAILLWHSYDYDRKFNVCMEQKLWQPECDNIHTFNPAFDCLNSKIDAGRSNTTWAVYYCAATIATRNDI